jgi:hypothetical protein
MKTHEELLAYQTQRFENLIIHHQVNSKIYSQVIKDLGDDLLNALPGNDFLNVHITGTKETLGRVFKVLRSLGFERPENAPQENQPDYLGGFRMPESSATVYVSFRSTVCRRVPVGKRTVEEIVYEVHCDG